MKKRRESALALLLFGFIGTARGEQFHIGCTGTAEDGIDLAAAIDFANDEQYFPGQDSILLTAGCQYTLSSANNFWYGPNGLPPIQSAIIIEGNGAVIARDPNLPLDTAHSFRLFYVSGGLDGELPAGILVLLNLTLKGGFAKGGDSKLGGGGAGMGGAIFNQGQLYVDSVTFAANAAQGGNTRIGSSPNGGGMGQDAQDIAAGGFGGALAGGPYGGLGAGGGGGFTANSGNASQGAGGGMGDLGGIAGLFVVPRGDGGSGMNAGGNFGYGGYNGGGGNGGGGGVGGGGGQGFFAGSGGFGGGGGYGSAAGAGGFGAGGGASSPGSGALGGFGGGAGSSGTSNTARGGGGAGMGGAIFNHAGIAVLTNCTLSGNWANGGVTFAVDGSGKGSGLGAAIFNLNGGLDIHFSTIAQNVVGGPPVSWGFGDGGVYSIAYGNRIQDGAASFARLVIANSIVYGTTQISGASVNDVVNTVVAGTNPNNLGNDSNLLFFGANVVGASNNQATLDPGSTPPLVADSQLGPLAANSAPNAPKTMSIGSTSPAIDAAVGTCPTTDERGLPRPLGVACDIGAYEAISGGDLIFSNGFDLPAANQHIFGH